MPSDAVAKIPKSLPEALEMLVSDLEQAEAQVKHWRYVVGALVVKAGGEVRLTPYDIMGVQPTSRIVITDDPATRDKIIKVQP